MRWAAAAPASPFQSVVCLEQPHTQPASSGSTAAHGVTAAAGSAEDSPVSLNPPSTMRRTLTTSATRHHAHLWGRWRPTLRPQVGGDLCGRSSSAAAPGGRGPLKQGRMIPAAAFTHSLCMCQPSMAYTQPNALLMLQACRAHPTVQCQASRAPTQLTWPTPATQCSGDRWGNPQHITVGLPGQVCGAVLVSKGMQQLLVIRRDNCITHVSCVGLSFPCALTVCSCYDLWGSEQHGTTACSASPEAAWQLVRHHHHQ